MPKISSNEIKELTPLQRSFLVIERLKSELNVLKSSQKEPIAIVGMGCRFPGGIDNPEALWRILHDGIDTIAEVPKNRWDIDAYYDPDPDKTGTMYTRNGGFLNEVDTFDAHFFNIAPREAISLDPQQRLLLEVSWQALENSHQVPEQLYESPAGVFIGICSNDYAKKLSAAQELDAYFGTGNAASTAAGRLSYFLGLTGPSLAVDTACSSSLVAVHLACQSLRKQECSLALAGGVNLLLSPENSIIFSQARMLSPDGRCKTFDAAADGYVRGEGCGVIVLKRLSDAIKDQNNILAVIRGSAINQDGPSGGLTVPNGPSQEKVIRQALENGGVEPSLVSYIEAHGTGTSLGDPIEVGAIGKVFGASHSQENPLTIGSLKTNMGHLEAAAGIAGLIKVVLQLQHEKIVPHLHLKEPNPYINWDELPVDVPTQLTPWSVDSQKRIAGVSSFGFSGTNAHVVLEEAPIQESEIKVSDLSERSHHILTLSTKSEKALQELAQCYDKFLGDNSTAASIADICFTAHTGRSHFNHRLAIITSNRQELADQLTKISAGEEVNGVFSGKLSNNKAPKIAFLFTGQGSQYINMGRQLYETQPVFRRTLDQCEQILQSYLKKSILEVIYPENTKERNNSLLDQTAYTQPALFALEYALAQLWLAWGIRPTTVMGHSLGEYVAACIAGVFSLEDALKLVSARASLMQALSTDGAMYAVMSDPDTVTEVIQPYAQRVAIAAINGWQNVVISGDRHDLDAIISIFNNSEIKTKQLQVSHAFHSPLMRPMLTQFEQIAAQVTYSQPKIKLISNLTAQEVNKEITTPEYWCRHILQPVNFAASMHRLQQLGTDIFLEVGAKPTLLSMGRHCLKDTDSDEPIQWLPSLRPQRSDWQQLLESLAQLYIRGVPVDWAGFDRDYPRKRIPLPTYPFQRQRFWYEESDRHTPKPSFISEANQSYQLQNQSSLKLAQQRDELLKANPEEQPKLLTKYFEQLLKQIMGLNVSQLDEQQRLSDLGLDSLMATELRKQLEDNLNIQVPVEFLAELSIQQFIVQVLALLQKQTSLPETNGKANSPNTTIKINTHDLWVTCPQPNPQAQVRLFCFPYAGAGVSCFRNWTKQLPSEIEICSIQLPGRENRRREAPLKRMKSIVETLTPILKPYLDKPFAFFGHSMGGLLSFELARELRRRNWQQPYLLLVSACRAPQLPDIAPPLHRLPEDRFVEKLKRLKGIPEEVLASRELMQLFLPTLRADFEMLETYFYLNEEPFDFPIAAFGGLEDNKVSLEELTGWREQTKREFDLQMFPGDHFFLHANNRELLPTLAGQIQKLALVI